MGTGSRQSHPLACMFRALFKRQRSRMTKGSEGKDVLSDDDSSQTPAASQPSHPATGNENAARPRSAATASSPPPSPSRLESLPAELRSQLLAALTDVQDLRATIRASPVLHQQYRQDRRRVLDSVLRNTLGDRVFVDACTVQLTVPRVNPPPGFARPLPGTRAKVVRACMEGYAEFVADPAILSDFCGTADFIAMAAFYLATIVPLREKLRRALLRNLHPAPREKKPLSRMEQTRLTRALYRFQLWCHVYGTPPDRPVMPGGEYDAMDPSDVLGVFFEMFPPWEIEEISCIDRFFREKYERVFARIRWDVHGDSLRFVNCSLQGTHEGQFDLAPNAMRRDRLLSGTVGRGLAFHLDIMRSPRHEQLVQRMQQGMCWWANSIQVALSTANQETRRPLNSEQEQRMRNREAMLFSRDADDKPPLAWVILWRGTYSNRFGEAIPEIMKRWGWVFWDCRRLTETRGKQVVKRIWYWTSARPSRRPRPRSPSDTGPS